MSEKTYTVFLSHSSKDKWIARQIARLIEDEGIAVFLDEKSIRGGDRIPDEMLRSIQECDELIVLLSQYSIDRQWVLIEVGAAWGLEKRIVPIIDKIPPEQMPDILVPHKAIDLNDVDDYLAELVDRVNEEAE